MLFLVILRDITFPFSLLPVLQPSLAENLMAYYNVVNGDIVNALINRIVRRQET